MIRPTRAVGYDGSVLLETGTSTQPDSAALRTAASISCRIRALNGPISIQIPVIVV